MPIAEPADRRPPHPVQRHAREQVFGRVHRLRQQRRQRRRRACRRRRSASSPSTPMNGGVRRHRERWDRGRAGGAARRRPHAAPAPPGTMLRGLPFEQQQFDGQHHRGDRRRERRRHARAAPATSSVLRSALVRWKNCAISEPIAPPVMMIGPSAPNGPPDPIEIADDSGLSSATLGSTRDAVDQNRFDRFGDAVAADLDPSRTAPSRR